MVEVDDVLHGDVGISLKESFFARFLGVKAHTFVAKIVVDDFEFGYASCTYLIDRGFFSKLEVGFGHRHLVEKFIESVEGVDELVVLCSDDGIVGEIAIFVGGVGVEALCAVGEGAFYICGFSLPCLSNTKVRAIWRCVW